MITSLSIDRRKIRLNIRVDLSGGRSVGPGKIALLEQIGKKGSLSEAARSLGMSYRRAWLLLDDLNKSFEESVATTAVGGSQGGGAVLTRFGSELVRQYRGFERDAMGLAKRRLAKFDLKTLRSAVPARVASRVRRVSRVK